MAGKDPPGGAGHGRVGPIPGLREEARIFFRLSPGGCYAIRRGDIIRRLDSYSNHPRFKALFARINGGRYPAESFDALSTQIFSGTTPLSKGDAYCSPDGGIPFVRSGQVVGDGSVSLAHDVWLRPEIHEGVMKRSQLRRDDLLIAIVGATIGAAGIYDSDDPANINQAIAAVRFRESGVLPQFAVAWLQTSAGQGILDYLKRPVARANINLEEIGEIVIPVPQPPKQRELLAVLNAARTARRRKLEEAKSLLDGIDAFILEALGLTLPPPIDALRQCWGVRLAETISERRLDPHRFAPRTRKLRKMIETGKFKTVPLASLLGQPVSGDWGVAEDERKADTDYVKALVIRATEFDDTENLILDNDRVRYRYLECKSFETRSLQAGDLVLEKSGGGPLQPVGRVALIEPEHLDGRQLSFTNFVMRLRPTGDVLPVYLWAFLGLVNRCGLTESMQAQTHGIRNLKLDEYLPQPVPLPDSATQKLIVAEVARRREVARRLREEAAKLWEEAKCRFEEELLGPIT